MAITGYRDGVFKAKVLQLEQKRYKDDQAGIVISSASVIAPGVYGWLNSTASKTSISTAIDTPRAVKFVNDMATTAERAVIVSVKGYTGQGDYVEENLTLSTCTTGEVSGNYPFATITSVQPSLATKGYGTYGTVGMELTDKFGLSEYCEDQSDVLQVVCRSGTAGAQANITSSVSIVTGTTYNKTYQTLDLSQFGVTGSTLSIRYLSKFQKRND